MRGRGLIPGAILGLLLTSGLLTVASAARPRHVAVEHAAFAKIFRADLIEPGKTQSNQLKDLLGKPMRRVQETAHHEFFFYGLGEGATMDATVSVRSGVVEYISYLCSESFSEIQQRYSGEASSQRVVATEGSGYTSSLKQVSYDGKGRGYLYEPRSFKVRACISWEPGKKFEELGR